MKIKFISESGLKTWSNSDASIFILLVVIAMDFSIRYFFKDFQFVLTLVYLSALVMQKGVEEIIRKETVIGHSRGSSIMSSTYEKITGAKAIQAGIFQIIFGLALMLMTIFLIRI